jgi:hypothetical protein
VRYVDVGMSDGDLNGDGYGDLAVGAIRQDHVTAGSKGVVYVYFGGPGGIPTAPSLSIAGPAGAGADEFGLGLATNGDLDADGYADMVVGAAKDGTAGAVFVFPGGPDGPSALRYFVIESPRPADDARFGLSVDAGGDVDGDGHADVVVGAERASEVEIQDGAAFLYMGSEPGLPPTLSVEMPSPSPREGGVFGKAVAIGELLGDDGFAEVAVGAPGEGDVYIDSVPGRIHVYSGDPAGISAAGVVDVTLASEENLNWVGAGVCLGQDADGEGRGNLAAPFLSINPESHETAFHVAVVHGVRAAAALAAAAVLNAGIRRDGYWFSTKSADLDGDGFDDIAVGLPAGYPTECRSPSGGALLFHGEPGGSRSEPWVSFYSPSPDECAEFGVAISLGDFDADGLKEVAVGAPYVSRGARYEGGVFLYRMTGGSFGTDPWISLDNPDNQVLGLFGSGLAP